MRRVFLLAVLSLWAGACAEASAAPPEAESLEEILVAARDLPMGTLLKSTDVVTRSVPSSGVTPSIIKPDAASYLMDQRVLLPMLAGDPVQWAFFENVGNQAYEACEQLEAGNVSAGQQVAFARQMILERAD
ncbi:MAG TPA: SAF domain-containing protein [Myxococcaceae bacterium]|jgi:Flp pilus assembly protein CpaB